MKGLRSWDKHQTLQLIDLYKENPCLWNPNNASFADRKRRRQRLEYIALELSKRGKLVTVQAVQQKIKTLLNQFKRANSFLSNPNNDCTNSSPGLWCYEQLSFMLSVYSDEELEEIALKKRALKSLADTKALMANFQNSSGKEEELSQLVCLKLKSVKAEKTFDNLKYKILELVRQAVIRDRQLTRIPANKPTTANQYLSPTCVHQPTSPPPHPEAIESALRRIFHNADEVITGT